ncbi:MAG: group 1 truncated hemoglobin [Polyangiaceae bacterium]
MTKFSLVSLVLLVGAGALAVGCGSDDDTSPTATAGAGGKSNAGAGGRSSAGASGKGGAGGSEAGASGAQNVEAGSGGEGGVGPSTNLYQRLGGHDGIAAAVDAIIVEELKDPVIVTYFSQQASPSHKPAKKDIAACFTNLLGKAAGGDEQYPFTTTSGFTCRSMSAAHATLGIGASTFDKFVMIAGGVLTTMNVDADDITAVAGVLNGTKTTIVDPNVPSGLAPCQSPASCSVPVSGDAGAGGATQ